MTPEEFLEIICPAMLTVSGYSRYITQAGLYTSSGYFGTHYNEALALRAAHLYTLHVLRDGDAGRVTQKTEGRMSISYESGRGGSNPLESTSYGMTLLELIHTIRIGGTVSDTAIYDTYLGA